MISILNAYCGYNGKAILQDASFSLSPREGVCVLGANGVGKTTLFRTLLGLLPLVAGSILINGDPIESFSHQKLAKQIAYVPQARAVTYRHPAEDIIMMGRAQFIKTFDVPSQEDARAVRDVMATLNISELIGAPYSELSGGEQQLVLIGRAMVQGATYILLDEPASNLDLANQGLLMKTINQLKQQDVGVLMISHDPTHAFACCENTLLFFQDGSSQFGKTEEIISTERLKKAYNTEVEIIEGMRSDGTKVHTYSFF